jgi:hypothetical protein
MTPCPESTPSRALPDGTACAWDRCGPNRGGPVRLEPGHTAYPRSMLGKLIVLVIVVAVLFWLLTKFRDSNRGGR